MSNIDRRTSVLKAADNAVNQEREHAHGSAEDNFAQIAALWSIRLGIPISAYQVAIMMVDLKTVRAWGSPMHHDSWVDMAGYAACGYSSAANMFEKSISPVDASPEPCDPIGEARRILREYERQHDHDYQITNEKQK